MSLFWINFLSETEDVQGVGIVNAPNLNLALMTAHYIGLPVDGYRMHIFGPFRPDAVGTYWWERLLTPFEADELDLSRAISDPATFDFYCDVPREPDAESGPDGPASASVETPPQDAGEGGPVV